MKTTQHNFAIATVITLLRVGCLCSPSALAQETKALPMTNISVPSVVSNSFKTHLTEFLAEVTKDKTICALLTKHEMTLSYHISDQNVRCYIGFINGKIQASYGEPATKSELSFVSPSKTLDRLFRGEDCTNEMQVTVDLNLRRKLALRHDIKPLREAMARVYLNAPETFSTKGLIAQNTVH